MTLEFGYKQNRLAGITFTALPVHHPIRKAKLSQIIFYTRLFKSHIITSSYMDT